MKWSIIIFIGICIAACADNDKIPKDIIQKDRMEKIMWDMLQADRFVNTFVTDKTDSMDEKNKQAAEFYARVFRMHNISKDEFIKSYNFYLGRPDITKVMFDSISARAERRRAEPYNSRRSPLMQKRDSIMRLDSIRKQDSLEKLEEQKGTTEEMSDSALKKALFNDK